MTHVGDLGSPSEQKPKSGLRAETIHYYEHMLSCNVGATT